MNNLRDARSKRLVRVNGVTEPLEQLRATATAFPQPPMVMVPYLDKVRSGAFTVTDDHVEVLRAAGLSEDEIFEHTVAAAIAEGLRRLDSGLEAIG
jgi:alkylhydroperoxidase family enzyme